MFSWYFYSNQTFPGEASNTGKLWDVPVYIVSGRRMSITLGNSMMFLNFTAQTIQVFIDDLLINDLFDIIIIITLILGDILLWTVFPKCFRRSRSIIRMMLPSFRFVVLVPLLHSQHTPLLGLRINLGLLFLKLNEKFALHEFMHFPSFRWSPQLGCWRRFLSITPR